MNDTAWVAFYIAVASGVFTVVAAAANAWFLRNKTASSTEVDRANAAQILTGSALAYMNKLEEKIAALEKRIEEMEAYQTGLELAIRDLYDGSRKNIRQIEAMGKVPVYKPEESTFRG